LGGRERASSYCPSSQSPDESCPIHAVVRVDTQRPRTERAPTERRRPGRPTLTSGVERDDVERRPVFVDGHESLTALLADPCEGGKAERKRRGLVYVKPVIRRSVRHSVPLFPLSHGTRRISCAQTAKEMRPTRPADASNVDEPDVQLVDEAVVCRVASGCSPAM
jgi:hypothetical protein